MTPNLESALVLLINSLTILIKIITNKIELE